VEIRLPEAHQKTVEDALRKYVDVRLDFYNAGEDKAKQAAAGQAAAQLQRELWNQAVAAGKKSPTPLITSFISAFPNIILPLLVAVAITLIADLDRPRGGLIGINQQPMLDLKQSLQPGQP
jgi:hypothetical protein